MRPVRAFLLILPLLTLLAPAAAADERACYHLGSVDTASAHPPGDPLASASFGELWDVQLLASLEERHRARVPPELTLTLGGQRQSAHVEAAAIQGRVAWSAPPTTWCSDKPATLHLVGELPGAVVSMETVPVAALMARDSLRSDGFVMRIAGNGMAHDVAPVTPHVDGPPNFTLLVTVRPDPSRPDLALPVHYHYVRAPVTDGVHGGGPVPPPFGLEEADGQPAVAEAAQGDPTEAAEEEEDSKSYLGDASSGWFHLGGGGALIRPGAGAFTGGGRFALGFGGYTFFFYGGAGFEMDFSPVVPMKVHGVGYLGVHLPIPVVHPIIGVKVAGGLAADPLGNRAGPSLGIGGQAGFIFRAFDRRGGFRFVVEPTFGLTGMGNDVSTFELWFVGAGVF